MFIKQISIFIENKKGKLAEITSILSKNNINIYAISIADTANFGILRIIVDKISEAEYLIKEKGYTVSITEVIAVQISDKPGGLNEVLNILDNHDINVEYLYSFAHQPSRNAFIIFRVEDTQKEEALNILKSSKIRLILQEEIHRL
ncbi:MAG: ACT domain-containing protein [Xylanivirga thermophila]|jgi:hypothetical protein|uniref:ACT domain-containing protein n=1 Tax=Xylanivirga thermophila TaxID=2496273 RepID=UPI00101D9D71|nr:ACT domain-containing protein [Xylanivirga thermophila]